MIFYSEIIDYEKIIKNVNIYNLNGFLVKQYKLDFLNDMEKVHLIEFFGEDGKIVI